jgi:hypothetical protein
MSEVYFALEKEPYLYDLKTGKLYKIVGENREEVLNHKLVHDIRYHSIEITRTAARQLQQIMETDKNAPSI